MIKRDTQKIIWPWSTKKWTDIYAKITDKINSIVEMDAVITTVLMGKLKPRQITNTFNLYHSDEQYAADRVPVDQIINDIIPFMQKLMKDAPRTFKDFDSRLLVPDVATNIVFTRPQIATIIVCIWFGLFDYNYVSSGKFTIDNFPEPTFINIFTNQNIFALQCLMTYFNKVRHQMTHPDENVRAIFAASNVIFKRAVLTAEPDWVNSAAPMCQIVLGSDTHVDKESAKMLTAFAHEYIGGDMFRGPLTQEEIILLVFPECIAATLICGALGDKESLTVIGVERMSNYSGYGSSVRFTGAHDDTAPKGYSPDETEVMVQRAILFIDASPRTSTKSQFVDDFMREVNKAYCGFSSLSFSRDGEPIACGNWSYGFNGNNMQVKLLQQIIAASQAGKSIIYCPTGDLANNLRDYLFYFEKNAEKFSVGALLCAYIEVVKEKYTGSSARMHDLDLFTSVIQQILF
jgi:hypothetical protein